LKERIVGNFPTLPQELGRETVDRRGEFDRLTENYRDRVHGTAAAYHLPGKPPVVDIMTDT
jgi:hypothetical protein